MFRRMLFALVPALLLASICGASLAQISPYPVPDEGVRGSGAILIRNTDLGIFDINVARSGSVIFGGFRYKEVSADGRVAHVIYSKYVTNLVVTGNTATVKAVGYWNGMPSDLMIEALDDLSGDALHIVARPQGPLTIIYDQAGGVVKGDIDIYSSNPSPDCYAKGYGAIQVDRNIGRFKFEAVKMGGAVKGSLYYVEYSPISTSAYQRPKVHIYLPVVEVLNVSGNTAILGGIGRLNGRPAKIEVRAVDNSMLMTPIPVPDEFYIKATPVNANSVSLAGYQAGGPLVFGEVSVGTL